MLTTFTLLTALAAAPAPLDLQATLAAPVPAPAPAPLAAALQDDRPTLGVSLDVGDGRLVITDVVSGSAAEAAGLQDGDRIAAVGGQPIPADGEAFERLVDAIEEAGVGGQLPLTYERDGELRDLIVTVGNQDGAVQPAPEAPRQKAFLGVNVGNRATISSLVADSAAERAGLLAGDRIQAIDGRDIEDSDQLGALLGEYGAGDAVAIVVERDGDYLQFDVTLGARPQPAGGVDVGSGFFFEADEEMDLEELDLEELLATLEEQFGDDFEVEFEFEDEDYEELEEELEAVEERIEEVFEGMEDRFEGTFEQLEENLEREFERFEVEFEDSIELFADDLAEMAEDLATELLIEVGPLMEQAFGPERPRRPIPPPAPAFQGEATDLIRLRAELDVVRAERDAANARVTQLENEIGQLRAEVRELIRVVEALDS